MLRLIGRALVNGTRADPDFITDAPRPVALAVNDRYIYWTNYEDAGSIGRANLNGSGVDQTFLTGSVSPIGLAVDAGGPLTRPLASGPAITGATLSRTVFPASSRGPGLTGDRVQGGADLGYRLSRASLTRLKVLRPVVGHRSGDRCLFGRRSGKGRSCIRFISVGSMSYRSPRRPRQGALHRTPERAQARPRPLPARTEAPVSKQGREHHLSLLPHPPLARAAALRSAAGAPLRLALDERREEGPLRIDHVGLDVTDYERSKAFYQQALAPLGLRMMMEPVARKGVLGGDLPVLLDRRSVARPADGRARRLHREGPRDGRRLPRRGARGRRRRQRRTRVSKIYHPNYYGAFVLDPDGNDVEAVSASRRRRRRGSRSAAGSSRHPRPRRGRADRRAPVGLAVGPLFSSSRCSNRRPPAPPPCDATRLRGTRRRSGPTRGGGESRRRRTRSGPSCHLRLPR